MVVKLSFLGPLIITILPFIGVSDGLPDHWSSWGVVGILMWFLFYTVKFWIPAIEDRKEKALQEQRRELLNLVNNTIADFLRTNKAIRISNNRDRKAVRRILREVVSTQKEQMEMIMKNAQTIERIMADKYEWHQQLMQAIRNRNDGPDDNGEGRGETNG